MNFFKLMSCTLSTLTLTLVFQSSLSAMEVDPLKIMEQVKWREDGQTRRSELEVTLIEKDGYERKREVSFYEKDYGNDRKTLLYVNAPADVRSTAILINSYDESAETHDDIWLYVPALRKVKRLSSRNKQGRFVGSEFTFADMERLQLRDYTYEYLGEEQVGERLAYKIEATPANEDTIEKTGYGRRLIWVDSERNLILRDQFFDEQGVSLKDLVANTVEQISGYWVATSQTITNHQSGMKTELRLKELQYDQAMNDLLFSQQTMRRGPR